MMKLIVRFCLLMLIAVTGICQAQEYGSTPILYAPWRDGFFSAKENSGTVDNSCPFCHPYHDLEYFVLRKFKYNVAALCLSPYAKGHVLILPLEHKGHLKDLSPAARAEMMELATLTLEILEKVYKIPGANVGFNIGKIAGASIPDHLHMHVVPRANIPNFLSVIGHTELIGFDVPTVYAELKAEFEKIVMP
jgi:ATP adenylyltransferase